ncbi:hypothetical protein F5888DRAFT_1724848 [Russula emetica]|nr:hypothetical protein F5888DRAFT_1724848 [Russula emetica]
MGFFQKFLSLGSRRSKKRRGGLSTETRSKHPLSREDTRRQQEEQEEIANSLLRSSSLRYAVVKEVDYSSLPPLPHPVNSLGQRTVAPPSRSASVQTRRTYTVTIRDRKVEALTEFPNANPSLDTPTHPPHRRDDRSGEMSTQGPVTPRDQNRLHMLRQDPSVASLLDIYDNKGRLDGNAFSNTPSASEKEPSKVGRAQLKRGGSTLRQLLGNPESLCCTGSTEGDISWAEGFLRERALSDDQSTESSFHLEPPKDMVLSSSASRESNSDTTLSDGPRTVDSDPHSSIPSVAVEPSYTSDDNPALPPKHTTEFELRPAAEVFGFLLEKRRSRRSITMNRDLPLSATSPWEFNSSTNHVHHAPATPSNTKHSPSHLNDLRSVEVPASADTPSTVGSILVDPPHTAAILNHTRIPILHGQLHEGSNAGQPTAMAITTRASRIPRGRRSLQIPSDWWTSTSETHSYSISPTEPIKTTSTLTPAYGALRSATNAADRPTVLAPHLCPEDDATVAPALMRSAHRRSASYGSSRPIPGNWDAGLDVVKAARVKGFKPESVNKENIVGTTENASMHSSGHPKSYLPMTPSRERALFSSYPSPASSSELSPLGQKMMADSRKQRQVRGERRRSRFAEATNPHV